MLDIPKSWVGLMGGFLAMKACFYGRGVELFIVKRKGRLLTIPKTSR